MPNTQVAPNPANILLGEGAVYYNYGLTGEVVVGATRGGGSFEVEREIKEIEYDGSYGPTKGLRRKTRSVPRLTLNFLEIKTATLTKFYGGLKSTDQTTYEEITEKEDIESGDYIDNVAFVGVTKDGKPVVILVENALGDGNIEMALQDKEEVVSEVQYTGHYDPQTPKVSPWKIRWPKL